MRWLLGLVLIVYPLLVYFGLQFASPSLVALCLLPLVLLRLKWLRHHVGGQGILIAGVLLLLLFGYSILANQQMGIRLYPVLINLVLLVIFLLSLRFPPSAIERLARLREANLPESGVRYTRKVTWLWAGFFALNGLVAAYTSFYSSLEAWTLYNGLIAYLLMGVLGAAEWLVRQRVRNRHGA